MLGKFTKALRKNILMGFVLVTPIGVTILVANWLFVFATNAFIPNALEDSTQLLLLRLYALLVVLMVLFLIGFFVRSILGKRFYSFGERIVAKIPIVNKIYISVRQISEAIIAQRNSFFQEAVLVEYPRKGLYSIGFLTSSADSPVTDVISDDEDPDLVALFIPTTPNPTSGLMIFAPRADTRKLDISVGDAMKLIVSGGAVYPADQAETPTLLDKLEGMMYRDRDAQVHTPAREDGGDASNRTSD